MKRAEDVPLICQFKSSADAYQWLLTSVPAGGRMDYRAVPLDNGMWTLEIVEEGRDG